jgi:aspartokinase/homoserine dehydrogenase 1
LKGICNGIYLIREISFYTTDLIMSFGELLSTKIIHAKCASLGMSCRWVDARELIKTDLSGSHNVVNTEATYRNIRKMVRANSTKIYIVPGFIATDSGGRTTTLGRGGSDYTAALLAVGAEARILEIWTDVNGMMTADPRIVTQAVTIENISYKEALELSHFGAKVVYPPTIQPVVASGIPILVKNTFNPHAAGTLIEQNPPEGNNKIKGISSSNRIALLSWKEAAWLASRVIRVVFLTRLPNRISTLYSSPRLHRYILCSWLLKRKKPIKQRKPPTKCLPMKYR